MEGLPENTVERALQNFGLTDKEIQVYIFVAKHGVQKGGDIAKKTKIAKAVVYRTLKTLQRKGFVEFTLESPVRYAAFPFESLLDLKIRTKHEEAIVIEKEKNNLLADWDKLSRGIYEFPIEKFTIIEGSAKIFAKIYQMIKQAKTQICAISSISGLLRADRYGVFEAAKNHPYKSKVKFHYITDLSNSDLKTVKYVARRLKELNLRGRNPEMGAEIFPRMIIRDQEEILFFISPKINPTTQNQEDICLCTNCKSMITAFTGVFKDLWLNSSEIEKEIFEIETGKSKSKIMIIPDQYSAKEKYLEMLTGAKKEIEIVTSSQGLIRLSRNQSLLEELSNKDVSIRVMAPIITENLNEMKQLLRHCEVRHVPVGYFETTIIDGQHLFQCNKSCSQNENSFMAGDFEKSLYTNDLEYIKRTKELLNNIWKQTRATTIEETPLSTSYIGSNGKSSTHYDCLERKTFFMRNMQIKKQKISEKSILSRIRNEKKTVKKYVDWSSTIKYFGTRAFALIDPPKNFGLPKMIIGISHNDDDSSFGVENWIVVNLWQKTTNGFDFVPVTFVQDNDRMIDVRKKIFQGFPVEKNILTFMKDEIEVQANQNTFFAGWTKAIPLSSSEVVLPPSCMLFESNGEVNPGILTNVTPSGRRQEIWYNSFDSFVTFFHPQSKYIGSGIEGFIERDSMLISRPPKQD